MPVIKLSQLQILASLRSPEPSPRIVFAYVGRVDGELPRCAIYR
jgi:hypothetical protein